MGELAESQVEGVTTCLRLWHEKLPQAVLTDLEKVITAERDAGRYHWMGCVLNRMAECHVLSDDKLVSYSRGEALGNMARAMGWIPYGPAVAKDPWLQMLRWAKLGDELWTITKPFKWRGMSYWEWGGGLNRHPLIRIHDLIKAIPLDADITRGKVYERARNAVHTHSPMLARLDPNFDIRIIPPITRIQLLMGNA